jgi:hypothetical protein
MSTAPKYPDVVRSATNPGERPFMIGNFETKLPRVRSEERQT